MSNGRKSHYHYLVEEFNKTEELPAPLHLTNSVLSLTAEMVSTHFNQIDVLTARLDNGRDANLYFVRAMEFATVKDFPSAVEDLNQAIQLRPDFTLAYFCRACITPTLTDYDKVIELQPDFAFAYFNRGNLHYQLREYQAAIDDFSNALQIDPDFGEAYYNRGLIYILIGDKTKGMEDLSKAGESGIYQAYEKMGNYEK